MPPAPFVLDNIMTKLINIVFLHELAVIASYGDSGPELLSITLSLHAQPPPVSPLCAPIHFRSSLPLHHLLNPLASSSQPSSFGPVWNAGMKNTGIG
jgi:hypothetical protein